MAETTVDIDLCVRFVDRTRRSKARIRLYADATAVPRSQVIVRTLSLTKQLLASVPEESAEGFEKVVHEEG